MSGEGVKEENNNTKTDGGGVNPFAESKVLGNYSSVKEVEDLVVGLEDKLKKSESVPTQNNSELLSALTSKTKQDKEFFDYNLKKTVRAAKKVLTDENKKKLKLSEEDLKELEADIDRGYVTADEIKGMIPKEKELETKKEGEASSTPSESSGGGVRLKDWFEDDDKYSKDNADKLLAAYAEARRLYFSDDRTALRDKDNPNHNDATEEYKRFLAWLPSDMRNLVSRLGSEGRVVRPIPTT